MGKRIISQARGHGSMTYRVKRQAFSIKPSYLSELNGEYQIIKLVHSAGHTTPLAKYLSIGKNRQIFFNLAVNGSFEGQKIKIGGSEFGDIAKLEEIKSGTHIFNIESKPKDGGKFVRTGGNSAIILGKNEHGEIIVQMPSKQEKVFNPRCRATIGRIAAGDRLIKPILKAGRKRFMKRAKQKLWPRTSAVKMNAVDHPFGSGRGKRIKSKIAKRNAPPGRKVGLIRPRRTGRRKK